MNDPKTLEHVKEQGYSDWQTLTSFFANLLLDRDNLLKVLKQLMGDVKLKVILMRDIAPQGFASILQEAVTRPSRN